MKSATPAGTVMLTFRPPGKVRLRVVPLSASSLLIARVACSGPSLCTATWKASAKAVTEAKRSSGCLERARMSAASMAGDRDPLSELGAGGGVM